MIVLGIETSCDETSVSIVKKSKNDEKGNILSECTLSQIKKHKKYGGVVPELASREHSKTIDKLVKKTIQSSSISINEIDAVAATTGPGLLGALLIGTNYAKAMSLALSKPFISVNHLQGHVLAPRISQKINFPYLCLLVSGGHCQILLAKSFKKFEIIGETLDDSVGEVYDKISIMLGLSYPGGPIIEKLAKKSLGKFKFNLPKPLYKEKNLNFSFSGLKTSVRRIIDKGLNDNQKYDLANEFQNVIADCLLSKVEMSIRRLEKKKIKDFVLSGGVASNEFIREKFKKLCEKNQLSFFVPEKKLCVDNASMIAWAGIEIIQRQKCLSKIHLPPDPRWRIDKL